MLHFFVQKMWNVKFLHTTEKFADKFYNTFTQTEYQTNCTMFVLINIRFLLFSEKRMCVCNFSVK